MTQEERVKQAEQLLKESGNEHNRRLIEIQEALKEDRRVLQLKAKIKSAAPGSIAQMDAQYKLNRLYLENMTEEERYYTDEGVNLEGETGELYRAIRDSRKSLQEAERLEEANEAEPTTSSAKKQVKKPPMSVQIIEAIFTAFVTFVILRACHTIFP